MKGREGLRLTAAPSYLFATVFAGCWLRRRRSSRIGRRGRTPALTGPLAGRAYRNNLSGAQPFRAVHHHVLSGLKATIQDRDLPLGQRHLDRLHPGGCDALGVGVYRPYKRSLQADLNGCRRHHYCVGPVFQHQVNVDELVGKERLVLVVEDGLQLVGSGGGVDLVVGGQQQAPGDLLHVAAVVGIHGHAFIRDQFVQHLGKLIFGQGKVDGDRLELIDNHQVGGIGGDDVAGVHQAEADAAVDGRLDGAPVELQLGGLDRCLIASMAP